MKKGLFVVLAMLLFIQVALAQTTKTGVLVIGNGSNAVGAGFQSAISGVKTTLLLQEKEVVVAGIDHHVISGLETIFLRKMREAEGIQDSTAEVYVDGTSANAVLKKWGDSIKNLTVIRNMKWSRIKRAGNNWNVQLEDGRVIKAEVLVNADGTGNVNEAIGLPKVGKQWQMLSYKDNLYRTSLAAGYVLDGGSANVLLLQHLMVPEQENLVVMNADTESLIGGQAAGATAAFAVFFKTKTSLANLKVIQKELINYQLAAMPFADIGHADSNWKAIQHVGLSGFLKANLTNGQANFSPEQLVAVTEIKEPMKAFYYKAQIWFDDYKEGGMTIGAMLSLVSRVGNKSPENTQTEVQKNWKTVYGFKTECDLKRQLNRREFAVLVDQYLSPFNVNIDKTGRVIR